MKFQVLFIFFISFASFANANDLDSIPDNIHVPADVPPTFQGCAEVEESEKITCSNKNLIQFIIDNIQYPEEAEAAGAEGVVVLRFVVNEEGEVENPEILRGIGYGCDEEAIRIMNLMPRWSPGTREGKPVPVSMTLPFRFQFKGGGTDKYQVQWGNLKGQTATKAQLNRATLEEVIARDSNGDEVSLSGLSVEYEKGRKFKQEVSNGRLTYGMIQLVKKAKIGSFVTLRVSVQRGTEFLEIVREFEVVR